MAVLLISDRFYSAPEVAALTNREVGAWMRMAAYHARWQDYDIPFGISRCLRITKKDISALTEHGWLIEGQEERDLYGKAGWRLGHADTGLWKIPKPQPSRPAIPTAIRTAVYERDGNECLHCGAADDLTLDHIVPYSHGGPDTYENLRVLCRPCNSRRGNRIEV